MTIWELNQDSYDTCLTKVIPAPHSMRGGNDVSKNYGGVLRGPQNVT
jgi:hypothetical protein